MKLILFLILFILILFILILLYIIRKENSKEDMQNLKAYTKANKLGKKYIKSIKKLPNKAAVMFDIDDTLLYVNSENLIPIKSLINLLNFCIDKELLIVIITARDNKYRQETINDLNKNNINYSILYCRNNPQDNYELFKSDVKKKLKIDNNIEIIMSVGDQLIDVLGEYSGYGLKLPNKSDPNLYETSLDGSKLVQVKI